MTEVECAVRMDQLETIVERIMTQRWDMAACRCWVCEDGRAAGCRPREQYLAGMKMAERFTIGSDEDEDAHSDGQVAP